MKDIHDIVHQFDEFAHQMLKTHLIIETRIDVLIGQVCKNPDAILSKRFGFWDKCQILEAILGEQEKNIWVSLKKFNSIRNEISHDLDAPKKAKLVGNFISELGLKTKGFGELKATEEYRLETCYFGFLMLLDWIDKIITANKIRISSDPSSRAVGD